MRCWPPNQATAINSSKSNFLEQISFCRFSRVWNGACLCGGRLPQDGGDAAKRSGCSRGSQISSGARASGLFVSNFAAQLTIARCDCSVGAVVCIAGAVADRGVQGWAVAGWSSSIHRTDPRACAWPASLVVLAVSPREPRQRWCVLPSGRCSLAPRLWREGNLAHVGAVEAWVRGKRLGLGVAPNQGRLELIEVRFGAVGAVEICDQCPG
jgi:hypothetical protein